jgi:cell division protein FtsL
MNRRSAHPVAGMLAVALIAILVAACSSAAAPFDQTGAGAGALSNVGGPVDLGQGQPAAQPVPAADGKSGSGTTSSDGTTTTTSADAASAEQALIVKTGTLDLQVSDVDAAVVRARTLISGFGGYVSGSQQTTSGDQPVASITYRVPADQWDAALNALRGLGTKVLSEKTDATEVTGQVVDLGARIENLRVTEAALQGIMAKATKISDILDVQTQLTDVQGQIEQLTTEQTHLQQQAADGTLTVGFEAPVVAVTTASNDWSLGDQVDKAVAQLLQVGQAAATGLVWLGIVGLPFLFAALILLGFPFLLLRRRIGRRPRGGPLTPTSDAGAA